MYNVLDFGPFRTFPQLPNPGISLLRTRAALLDLCSFTYLAWRLCCSDFVWGVDKAKNRIGFLDVGNRSFIRFCRYFMKGQVLALL